MNATWAMISYDCLNFLLTGFDPWILVGAFQDVAPPKPKPPLSHRIMWNTKGTGKFSQWDGVFNLWIDLFRNQAMRSHFRTLVETLQSGQSFCFYLVFVDVFSFRFHLICQAHGILLDKCEKVCCKELRKSGGFAARAAHFGCESFVSALSDQARDREFVGFDIQISIHFLNVNGIFQITRTSVSDLLWICIEAPGIGGVRYDFLLEFLGDMKLSLNFHA